MSLVEHLNSLTMVKYIWKYNVMFQYVILYLNNPCATQLHQCSAIIKVA